MKYFFHRLTFCAILQKRSKLMNIFIEYLTSISKLSNSAIHYINEYLSVEKIPKKQVFVQELSASKKLYFIKKGIVRAFFYNDGKEITDWFGIENMIIGATVRNFPIKNTRHSIETLEDTELVSVSFNDLEKLYQKHHDIERLGRLIAINTILFLQHKIDTQQLFSAKERYDEFVYKYPNLINRVPLGYIASYLGMNQVTLSRIRNQY